MKLCRCPICHSDLHLDALMEDGDGRELLGKMLQLPSGLGSAMSAYLGLFRPAKSSLSNSRALKICNEVLELFEPSKLLAHCLSETVQAVRKKRLNGQKAEPLTNHNYLKSVYETQKATFTTHPATRTETPKAKMQEDKTRTAIEYIERYALAGQLDYVKHQPEYQIWLNYKNQKEQKNSS